ncbi:hypothetical protein [Paraliomyxa miuraensis]|uniref:hypothetical protein n=1 Tax=Paraliomyxa miuraensis TaxID=376150 RepID=UPI00225A5F1E|nr:hypothetical protein [Paraliomyxa miuraensis]
MKAKLGWLWGYPSAQGWTVVPSDGERSTEELVLDRDHLRRATYTANKLRGEFPRALPVLVGDVDAWQHAVSHVLATLKPWVHHGQAPPAELFETEVYSRTARARAIALRREHPRLRGLVDALSWVMATRAVAAAKALAWVDREAEALTVLLEHQPAPVAIPLGIELVQLATSLGPKAVMPLLRLVGEPASYRAPAHGAVEYLQRADALFCAPYRTTKPAEPRIRLPGALSTHARWLLAQDRATAKRSLEQLARCDLVPLLIAWDEWWPAAAALVSRAHAICAHQAESPERSRRLGALRGKAIALRERHPGEVAVRELLAALRELVARLPEAHAPLGRILGRLSGLELAPLRAGLVIQWSHLLTAEHAWWNPRRLLPLLRTIDEHLRVDTMTPARIAPWREDMAAIAATGRSRSSIDQDLLEEDGGIELADVPRVFEALRWIEAHEPSIALDAAADGVLRQVEATHDAELAARLVVELERARVSGARISVETLRAAWMACDPHPEFYADVVRVLERIENLTELRPLGLVQAVGTALHGDRPLLRALLLDDDPGLLVRCGRKLAALQALGSPVAPAVPTPALPPDWVQHYPASLRDDLVWLCHQSPRAEAIAAKLLRSIHRPPEDTAAQRRAIEAMLPGAAPARRRTLEARLTLLEQQQARPAPTPSVAKLERLRTKLRRRGALARLEALEREADAALPGAVAHELGLPSPPPSWALEERVLSLIGPLRREPEAIRQLARTLFQARAGPPPWDLRTRPANAAFLASLVERGLDVGPWLDGLAPVEVGKGTDRLTLRLEDDPLEVFHMGHHFGTCLSPGQCNFFSVFANAADINKRVLYARDVRGGVVGRRLLCLTRDGAVLAFNAYCHDQGTKFEDHSTVFTRRLAEAMGTIVVGRASIPRLLAPDWYDDGPVDIVGQLAALDEGSSFREALREVPPATLPQLVARVLDTPKLDEAIAPMVIALPEIGARPELGLPLLGLVRHPERLPLPACQRLAHLLVDAGAESRARDVLAEPFVRALMLQHRQHRWMNPDALEQLAGFAPSRVLEVLRRTRPRGVRRWDDEASTDRLMAAGAAMEALHRRTQAIRMYRLAAAAHGSKADHKAARRRLRALEAE